MKCSNLILTIGIPGAGKTSWVEKYKKTHPLTYVVSTDQLRKELTGVEQCVNPSQNEMIHNEARKRVKQILDDPNSLGGLGPEIIVDSTNCSWSEWYEYKKLGATIMRALLFECTPEQANLNQLKRERKVPIDIIRMKWRELQASKHYLPSLFNMIDIIQQQY